MNARAAAIPAGPAPITTIGRSFSDITNLSFELIASERNRNGAHQMQRRTSNRASGICFVDPFLLHRRYRMGRAN